MLYKSVLLDVTWIQYEQDLKSKRPHEWENPLSLHWNVHLQPEASYTFTVYCVGNNLRRIPGQFFYNVPIHIHSSHNIILCKMVQYDIQSLIYMKNIHLHLTSGLSCLSGFGSIQAVVLITSAWCNSCSQSVTEIFFCCMNYTNLNFDMGFWLGISTVWPASSKTVFTTAFFSFVLHALYPIYIIYYIPFSLETNVKRLMDGNGCCDRRLEAPILYDEWYTTHMTLIYRAMAHHSDPRWLASCRERLVRVYMRCLGLSTSSWCQENPYGSQTLLQSSL